MNEKVKSEILKQLGCYQSFLKKSTYILRLREKNIKFPIFEIFITSPS